MANNNVGEYIKSLRLSRGLTQEQLGEIIGVQKAAVQKWECGKTQNLKRSTIKKLADYFGVSPVNFVKDEAEESSLEITDEQLKFALFGDVDIDDDVLDDVKRLAKMHLELRRQKAEDKK